MLSWISWVFIPCIFSSKFWCCSNAKEQSQSSLQGGGGASNSPPTGANGCA